MALLFRCLILLLAALGSGLAAADSVVQKNQPTLFLSIAVDILGNVTTKAKSAMPATAGAVLQDRFAGAVLANPTQIASVSPLSTPALSAGTLTTGQIQALAQPYFNGRVPLAVASARAYMTAHSLDLGWIDYQQAVNSKGRVKYITFSVSVERRNKFSWGGVQVLDSAPTVVYITYTSLAVRAGLPAGWAYPNAGMLTYDVRDMAFNPVTAPVSINTFGAFDEPAPNPLVPQDPNALLKCLIDSTSSAACPAGFPDAKGLIVSTDSVRAVVDYVRQVQPKYVYDPVTTNMVAQAGIDVYSRIVKMPSCCCQSTGQQYINSFNYGFTLQQVVDRDLVNSDGSYLFLNRFITTALSPTVGLTKQVPLVAAQLPTITGYIIDPGDATNPLVPVSKFGAQIVNLAPVIYQ